MSAERLHKACVVGSGSWGTAFCGLLAPSADEAVLWCRSEEVASGIVATHKNPRHLSDYVLPGNVSASADAACAVGAAELIVLALPSAHLRSTCKAIAAHVDPSALVLVLTKGMEEGTGELMLDVAADELGHRERMACLSGPNHAEEICLGQVSAAVIASENLDVAKRIQAVVSQPAFRAYVSDDVVGTEVCGAVKNIVAIAAGIAAGAGAGDNTLAVLMTRGIAEISRLVSDLGGNPMTPMGLAGMGDLVATCTSRHSRNRTFGEALVAGETLEGYESRTHMVVEGARAAMSVWEIAQKRGIEAPITSAVHDILVEGLDVEAARGMLLGRLVREEFYGIRDAKDKELIK